MVQKISEYEAKKQLGLSIITLIKLWESFEEKNNPSYCSITETQKKLEEVTKALKKYKKTASINSLNTPRPSQVTFQN
jgi:hypothetical protein